MIDLNTIGERAKKASRYVSKLGQIEKNNILVKSAETLIANSSEIIKANNTDIENARTIGLKESLIDRLFLNNDRIKGMADGLIKLVSLDDPIGEFSHMRTLPNGLIVGQKTVPLGVVGIIYESRPNVTSDVFGLCLKSSNASIFRGGKEAINSNIAIVSLFQNLLESMGHDKNIVQLIEDTNRSSAVEMMKMNKYLDVLIPRGSSSLIQTVVENSTVPVIETGIGNCHVFVDEYADVHMALKILINAKTQRTGVCNTCESLLVHKNIADKFLLKACEELTNYNVEIRGDEETLKVFPSAKAAAEEDYATEFLDLIISVKVVDSIDDAIEHIHKFGTSHSEVIVTENYNSSQKFLDEIDAAAVYVNASSRFTDGFEFGLGAEVGISTQKLHARGPMGLKELTTYKYIIYGSGQIRP